MGNSVESTPTKRNRSLIRRQYRTEDKPRRSVMSYVTTRGALLDFKPLVL